MPPAWNKVNAEVRQSTDADDFSLASTQTSAPLSPPMGNIRTLRTHILLSCSLLLCRGALADSVPAQLPPDVPINKEAGRGGFLVVTVRLESGEDLPFVVDTGSPITLLDKSFEPKLGKSLETMTFSSPAGGTHDSGIHPAPKLYLGGTPLVTGAYIATYPLTRISKHSNQPIMGILGLDCLRHYCVQLDFPAAKLRFLSADQVHPAELGRAFPLSYTGATKHAPPMFTEAGQNLEHPLIHHPGLFTATNDNLLLDTGDNVDGEIRKGDIRGHYGTRFLHFLIPFRALRLPETTWDGNTYTNFRVGNVINSESLGLRFLARHLVTFDFPNGTLYLKQQSAAPLSSAPKQ